MADHETMSIIKMLMNDAESVEKRKHIYEQALNPFIGFESDTFLQARQDQQIFIENLHVVEDDSFSFRLKHACGKCGKNNWTTQSVQTRSADEGETVFFVCTTLNCDGRRSGMQGAF